MKRLLVILITFFISHYSIVSQENELDTKIKAQLNATDKKNVEKAEKLLNEAISQMKTADETESVDSKKAFKIRIKASKNFGKANKMLYRVYSQDLKQFFNNVDPVKAKKAELKIDKARLQIKEAKKTREKSLKLNVAENVYLMLKKADNYETAAINNLKDVYGMFIGSNKIVGDERPANIVIETNESENKQNVIDEKKEETNTEIVDNKTDNSNKTFVPIKVFGTKGVFFLIQVAASKTPISEDYLRKNYKENIHGELFGDWYRYVINERFATLEEAEKYKANAGIRGTLIIAIKNGQKVSIQEAQKKEVVNLEEMEYAPVGKTKTSVSDNRTISTSSVIYKLEIGISISRLTAAEVRKLKNGGKAVVPIDRGGWYSYTVGDFKSQSAALNFKRIKGLSDASVLKVRDGKIID